MRPAEAQGGRHGRQHARVERRRVHARRRPELVGEAIPFGLKLYESLLDSAPKNKDLLIATCSNFTQYGVAYPRNRGAGARRGGAPRRSRAPERAGAEAVPARAAATACARWRCGFPGIGPKLLTDPAAALAKAEKKDVPLLYWTAASWGSAIALGVDKPDLVIDMPVGPRAGRRALALDETWSKGALHEMFISLDSLPEALGGSPARAREHFKRAVELQKGALARALRRAGDGRRRAGAGPRRVREAAASRRWPSTPRRIRRRASSRSSSSAARARCSITSTRCSEMTRASQVHVRRFTHVRPETVC